MGGGACLVTSRGTVIALLGWLTVRLGVGTRLHCERGWIGEGGGREEGGRWEGGGKEGGEGGEEVGGKRERGGREEGRRWEGREVGGGEKGVSRR